MWCYVESPSEFFSGFPAVLLELDDVIAFWETAVIGSTGEIHLDYFDPSSRFEMSKRCKSWEGNRRMRRPDLRIALLKWLLAVGNCRKHVSNMDKVKGLRLVDPIPLHIIDFEEDVGWNPRSISTQALRRESNYQPG
jgi:hypothetical protein